MKKSTLGDRIKVRRKELGISQEQLGKLSGLAQPTISSLERNDASNTRNIASVAHALQVNALWLQTGVGDPKSLLKGEVVQPDTEVISLEESQGIRIRVAESRGSCGGGDPSRRDVEELARAMPPIYKQQTFFTSLGVEPSDVTCIIADGDGMANYIVHGDTVFFSTSHCERLIPGHIYAINAPTGVQIRRMIQRSDGHVILSFDHPDKVRYPNEDFTPEQAENISIFGRFLRREGGLA
jgi:transcriptional regulator with XRE-family HTH domain